MPGAVERLREHPDEALPLVLAAADPAQPYGAALPWPKRAGARAARVGGALVVLRAGEPLLYVERGAQMTFVLQSCLLLVSGVYYSVSVLPGWMQALSRLSPATYVLDGVRKGVIDGAPVTDLLYDVWPLIVMGAILIPFALWAFSRAERYAKRTGRLKRVG